MTTREWAQRMIQEGCLILDTETTGLKGEVIELAIINSDGQTLFHRRIKPIGRIEEAATAVHGIRDEDLEQELSFPLLWPEIFQDIDGKNIVAYNADFDFRRLHYTMQLNQIRMTLTGQWHCLMKHYSLFAGIERWQRLNEACRQMNIQHEGQHSALGDCLAALELLRKMAKGEKA